MYKIFEQLLCAVLIGLILCPPALAGGIQADSSAPAANQASVSAAKNGVPLVNIVKPNSGGVSHNMYHDFNVGAQGVIINNSNMPSVSQLGGVVGNNPNFTDGRKAGIILNEVTSTNRSLLQGYTEVLGGGHYILANPNGVTIDGGGFIGTPKATVTTGAPTVNGGNVMLGVTGGDVLIEGSGINARNIDAFKIVSRTATINADIHAKRLKIVAGKSNYDPATGKVTEVAPNGDPLPAVVIDSTALGGMYAGRISLVGTEKGVGVNLEGITQSTDNLQLTAEGRIEIKNKVGSGGDLSVASNEDSVNISGTVVAAGTATLSAADTVLIAKNDSSDTALVKAGTVTTSGGTLDNQHLIAADSHFDIGSDEVVNTGTIYSAGTGAFHVSGTVHNDHGAIQTKDDMILEGATAGQRMNTLQNDSSRIESTDGTLTIRATNLNNTNVDFQLVRDENELSSTDGVWAGGDDNSKVYTLFSHYVGRSYSGPGGWTAYYLFPRTMAALKMDTSLDFISSEDMAAHLADVERKLAEDPNYLNSDGKISLNTYKTKIAQGYKYFVGARGQTNGVIFSERKTRDGVTGEDAGSLLAAQGAINIEGYDVRNVVSTITSAAGDINIDSTEFDNVGKEVFERTYLTWGRAAFHSHQSPSIEYKGGGTVPFETPAREIHGSIDAGNNVNITAKHTDNGITERKGVFQEPDLEARRQTIADIAQLTASIPGNGLFVVNTDKSHPYLIETNPELTDLSGYMGSKFLLEQIGEDAGEMTRKRLGDAYYETQLIRKQVMSKTGRRFLETSIKSDAAQVQALMENALAVKDDLDLSIGVGLSAEQIADLDKDIVWLVEQEIQGQKVLVPVFYLGKDSLDRIAAGGSVIIAAGDVNITATADVTNAGTILADNKVSINADNIFNHRGTVQAQEVALTATDTVTNTGGTIKGTDVVLKADNDVALQAAMYDSSLQETSSRIIAGKGSVVASNSLSIEAGRDVAMNGSGIKSDGDASIQAGRSVAVSTVETHTKASMSGSNYDSRTNITTSRGGTIEADGNLDIKADQDVIVHGSEITAQGDVNLEAGGNVSVTSATNKVDLYSHADDAGGMFGGSKSSTFEQRESTNVASVITSGGDTNITAGSDAGVEGDLSIIGSRVSTEGDLNMQAQGAIAIASAEEKTYSQSQENRSGTFKSTSETERINSVTQEGSDIASAGSVTATAKRDLNISASNIYGQEAVTLTSEEGNVNIVAAQNESSSYEKKESKKVGLFASDGRLDYARMKDKLDSSDESNSIGSSIVSDKDITVTAQNDAVVVGSDLSAGGDITINAGRDANVLSGRNEKKTKKYERQAGLGIGFKFSEDEISVSSGLKATETTEKFSGSYNAKSTLSAGNDVTITAGQNVNQVSSDIKAGQDVALEAGGDVKTEAAHDIEKHDSYVKELEVGVKAAAKQNVTSALRTVAGLPKTMTAGKGNSAAKAATAASAAMQAYSAVNSAMSTSVSASITGGATYTESREKSESKTAVGSNTTAGRNVTIKSDKDVTIDGGRIAANEDVTIQAGEDVNVNSAKNTYESSSSTTTVDARGGVSASFGSGGGSVGITASASLGGSDNDSEAETHDNGEVTAGKTLTVESGKDTTLEGANLAGDEVIMKVGENLAVRSVQDTAAAKGYNYNVGGSATVGMGVNVSANVGFGQSKSESKWVERQTSVIGKEKVDIYTGKNTHVEGAVIAAENDNLVLNTETLTYKDIQDSDTSEAFNTGVSVSAGFGDDDKGDNDEKNDGEEAKEDDSPYSGTSTTDYSSKDKEQINRATIGKGTIIIRSNPDAGLEGLNRDLAKAQEITKDSETSVKIYIDPATIKDIANGGEGLQENAEKWLDGVEKVLGNASQKIKDAFKRHRKTRDRLVDMGLTQEQINELYKNPEAAARLETWSTLQEAIEEAGGIDKLTEDDVKTIITALKNRDKSFVGVTAGVGKGSPAQATPFTEILIGNATTNTAGVLHGLIDIGFDVVDAADFALDMIVGSAYQVTGIDEFKPRFDAYNKKAESFIFGLSNLVNNYDNIPEALETRVNDTMDEYWRLKSEGKDWEAGKFIGPACKDIVLGLSGGGALAAKGFKGGSALVTGAIKRRAQLTEITYEVAKANRTIKKVAMASDKIELDHLNTLKNNMVKFNPENVMFTHKMPDGKVVFLERGNSKGGLAHILRPKRTAQFVKYGIPPNQIFDAIHDAIKTNKIIRTEGITNPKKVFEVILDGQKKHIAIGISDNGYIVTAIPRSIK